MNRRIVTVILVLIVGVAVGFGVARFSGPDRGAGRGIDNTAGEKEILYWVAPMDPNYRRDAPGKSPMGMDLIPVYEGEDTGAESTVRIDPSIVNNIGVQTAQAETTSLNATINTVGRITVDEELAAQIHVRSNGWIERLAVRAEGEPVTRGDLLFEVYSPDLVNAQAEFLQALRSGRASIIKASRERLRALGIAESQIADLEQARTVSHYVQVYAPISGVVTSLKAADGMYVMPQTQIMALADLSRVWLISDIFEADTDRVKPGAEVKAWSAFEAGTSFSATIDYVYPDLNPVTRTVPARAVLANPKGDLKPGMFMTVRIETDTGGPVVTIPREALIRTGREERVILALGDGRFQPAQVVSGRESGGKVEILSGLSAGETVVVSGQFLIDSESSFSGATLRMAPETGDRALREDPAASTQLGSNAEDDSHAGHDMPMASEASIRHEGMGTVNAIIPGERKVTLSHGPIDSLGWPAMTMDLSVAETVDLGTMAEGDHVRFTLERLDAGGFIIRSMEAH
ncbi:MAG: efflux RND transporter periplasmic adaptor subunit [Alphaproteobacteria bacterium]